MVRSDILFRVVLEDFIHRPEPVTVKALLEVD